MLIICSYQIACNAENPDSIKEVDLLEMQIYEKQLVIFDNNLAILDEEEKLLRHRIDKIVWYKKGSPMHYDNE